MNRRELAKGSLACSAKWIHKQEDGGLFPPEVVGPYPEPYGEAL